MKKHRNKAAFVLSCVTAKKCQSFVFQQNRGCSYGTRRDTFFSILALAKDNAEIITGESAVPSLADALNEIFIEEFQSENPKEEKKKVSKSKPRKRTKAQIKKLKFLMNTDVEKLIEEKNATAIEKAENNIERLQALYESDGNPEYKPKILNWNHVIRAYGKSQLPDGPEQTVSILQNLNKMYAETGDEDIRPTVITYTECIDAFAKSKKKNAAEKAEELLFTMMDEAENDDGSTDDRISPTSITCDVVLNAWARTGTVEGATRAEQILERMEYLRTQGNVKIQPTAYSFATVITAWAKAKVGRNKTQNAERAQFILNRMNDFRRKIGSKETDREYASQLYPDAVVYNAVLDAWARSRDPVAGTRAEELLAQLEELSRQDDKLSPDTITYNSVINCHANSLHMNAAKAAESILMKMEKLKREGSDIRPNTLTYNQVLKTYSKSKLPGAAQRADMILKYMIHHGIRNDEIRPDVVSFSTCLDVWAKSKEPGKAEKAYAILQKMIEFHKMTGTERMKPNQVTYNTVFNACAFSAFTPDAEKKQALKIAVNLFKEMQNSDVKPDAITYGMMIKCIANLMPRGKIRNRMASDLFNKCKAAGLVNGLVFDEIRRAVPGGVISELLKDVFRKKNNKRKKLSELELRDLPYSWKAKVIESNPKKRRTEKKNLEAQKEKKVSEPVPIRPMRQITETSWQSGRDC